MRLPPWDRLALAIRSRATALPDTVFCGATALFIHGLPLLDLPERIEMNTSPESYPRTYPALTDHADGAIGRQHWGFVTRPGQMTTQLSNGFRVQAVTDAVGEYLRDSEFRSAVVVLDAYRHRLRTEGTPLNEIPPAWLSTGVAAERQRVRQVWNASDDLAESPAETLARINAASLGFEKPQLQVWVKVANGKRYRTDMMWKHLKLVAEIDGRGKLGETPEDQAAALREERERQEALQQMGFHVFRITFDEARDPVLLRRVLMGNGVPFAVAA
jgi:very-short-patch-repair endonuclease